MGLLKPKWQHKNPDKRLKAVEGLDDQEILVDISKNDEDRFVRSAAVEKLDPDKWKDLLADIAKNDKFQDVKYKYPVRVAAVEKLEDQKLLAGVAVSTIIGYGACREAVGKLNDQKLLAYVAKNAKDRDVRIKAVEKLEDQKTLAWVAKNDSVRLQAIEKIGQDLIAELAKNDKKWVIRWCAVENLDPGKWQDLLSHIAKNDKKKDVREAAVKKLKDQKTFKRFHVFLVPNRRDCQMTADYVNSFLRNSNLPESAVTVMAKNISGKVEIEAMIEGKIVDLEKAEQKYILFVPTPTLENVKTNTNIWKKSINVSEQFANITLDPNSLMMLAIECSEIIKK